MNAREQTVGILERAAPSIATRERWPAGLLARVQLALNKADPAGLDWLATRQDWYVAGYEALADVPENQAEADALQSLFKLATTGSGAFNEEQAGLPGQVRTQAEEAAAGALDKLDTAGRILGSPWAWVAGAAALGGAVWLATRR